MMLTHLEDDTFNMFISATLPHNNDLLYMVIEVVKLRHKCILTQKQRLITAKTWKHQKFIEENTNQIVHGRKLNHISCSTQPFKCRTFAHTGKKDTERNIIHHTSYIYIYIYAHYVHHPTLEVQNMTYHAENQLV